MVTLTTFTVTGSNIRRMDQEKVLPVLTIDKSFLEARNASTPIEVIASLPQIPNVPQNESANGGATQRGDFSSVNLRGIGAGNTLVLFNGRRLVTHPISSADSTSGRNFVPNINQMPTVGLARLEVLRDGASSLYGSDAVAGVVNYISDDDFRGTSVKVRYSLPEYGGNQTVQGSVLHGVSFANGRGSIVTSLGYIYRDMLFLRDRPFSASANHSMVAPAPFNVPGSAYDGRSALGAYPIFSVGTATTRSAFYPLGAGTDAPVLTNTLPTRAAAPAFYQNVNEWNVALPRSNRLNILSRARYELIPDQLTAFTELMYYNADSVVERSPSFLNAPNPDTPELMSPDNPYNPYGSRFYSPTGAPNSDGTARLTGNPQAITLYSYQPDTKPFHIVDHTSLQRVLAGLRGKIGETWRWEGALLYSRASASDLGGNYQRESRMQQALLRNDSQALNPFQWTFKVQNGQVVADKPYTQPASVMEGIYETFAHHAWSSLASADFSASGEVINLWGGPVSAAFGGDIRHEAFKHTYNPYSGLNPQGSGLDPANNDFVVQSPVPDSAGERTIYSVYGEVVIPLIAPKNQIPFAKSMEVTASGRREEYPGFGSATKPKLGMNWKPMNGIMLRGSYNEGFQAPNLDTINSPRTFTTAGLPGLLDLYRNTATNEGSYIVKILVGGNPDLLPMESVGKSAGIVLTVPKIKGLTLTADYWQLTQSNIIGAVTTGQLYSNDQALLTAYTNQQLAAGVPVDQINLGAGTASYKGDPAVVRFAPTSTDSSTFAAYNAKNPSQKLATVGQVASVATPFINLASGYASGWDFSLNYRCPFRTYGVFNFNTDWSYNTRSYTYTAVPGKAPLFADRQPGLGRWRGNAILDWRKGAWSANLGAFFFDNTPGATTTAATYLALGSPGYIMKYYTNNIDTYAVIQASAWSFNCSISYDFKQTEFKALRNTSVRLGVVNLTDRSPPLTSGANGFDPGTSLALAPGRTWTFELTKRL